MSLLCSTAVRSHVCIIGIVQNYLLYMTCKYYAPYLVLRTPNQVWYRCRIIPGGTWDVFSLVFSTN